MSDTITVTGIIATPPRNLKTSEGLAISSFRLASTQRRYDRGQQKWVDGDTNWFTVTAFRLMATNISTSLQKGDRVVVTGRMHIREWVAEDRKGTTVEIEADALGHDLYWGTTSFTRTLVASTTPDGTPGESSTGESAPSDSFADAPEADAEAEPGAHAPASTSDSVVVPF